MSVIQLEPDLSDLERDVVPSVTKALQLLDTFRTHGPTLGVSQISRLAGVPKSTAFRLLAYLEQSGFVERDGRGYCLGRRLFELGNSVALCRPDGLRETAAPHLTDLFVATSGKAAVHLAVLEDTDVVYLEKIAGPSTMRVPTRVGGRMNAACSGLGKAILGFSDRAAIGAVLDQGLERRTRYSAADPVRFLQQLRRVRAEGVAYDREEVTLGLVCAAAPILVDGRPVGAISLSGHAIGFNPTAAAPLLQRTAAGISRDLAA
jgi:IclR family transcriptional regulator, KDG regulon repressor